MTSLILHACAIGMVIVAAANVGVAIVFVRDWLLRRVGPNH